MAHSIFNDYSGSEEREKEWKEIEQHANEQKHTEIDISQIETDIVPLITGEIKIMHPKATAQQAAAIMDMMRNDQSLDFIHPYIQKPIIWTYEITTACTDGVRIFCNPYFAEDLIFEKGIPEAKSWAQEQLEKNKQKNTKFFNNYNDLVGKYLKFIIIHEVYHVLYCHLRRGTMHDGERINNDPHYHSLANISMDMEINRDIESFFKNLSGTTTAISGIWYQDSKWHKKDGKLFGKDVWEDIYDYLDKNNYDISKYEQQHPSMNNDVEKVDVPDYYAKGWDAACAAIDNGLIDPLNIKF